MSHSKEQRKIYYQKNKDKINQKRRLYWAKHKDRKKEIDRKHYIKNRDSYILKAKIYIKEHPEIAFNGLKRRRKEHPEKDRARFLVLQAIKKGKIVKQPCEVCGTKIMIHAHHKDYRYPLMVKWLCPKHHALQHVVIKGTEQK